jgi:site-specific DNA-methyltransferase (adenine-specific)
MACVNVQLTLNNAHIALYTQDCIAGMEEHLAPGSVDVIVTSPPYNLGVRYGRYDDRISRAQYLSWMRDWAIVAKARLADGGSLFLNVGSKPSDPAVPFEVLDVMRQHFVLQNTFHWIKSIAISKADAGNYDGLTGDIAVGHFKPINSPRYVNDCHEYIFHLTKHGDVMLDRLAIGVPYQDKSNVSRWRGKQDVRCRGNTWFIPYETIKSRDKQRPHPATFPPKLAEMCIRLHGLDRVSHVCDPFLGIGSSAVACVHLCRSFAGFEIDSNYIQATIDRLKNFGRISARK